MVDFPRFATPIFRAVSQLADTYSKAASSWNVSYEQLAERDEYLQAAIGGLVIIAPTTTPYNVPAPGTGERFRLFRVTPGAADLTWNLPAAGYAEGDRIWIELLGTGTGRVWVYTDNDFYLGTQKTDFGVLGDRAELLLSGGVWTLVRAYWSSPPALVQKIVSASTNIDLPQNCRRCIVWAVGGGAGGAGGQASAPNTGTGTIAAGYAGAGGGAGECAEWTFVDAVQLQITIGSGGAGGAGDATRPLTNQWSLPSGGGQTIVRVVGSGATPPGGWPAYTCAGGRAAGAVTLDCNVGGIACEVPDRMLSAGPSPSQSWTQGAAQLMPGSGSPANCAPIGPTVGNRAATTNGGDTVSGATYKGSDGGGGGGIPVPRPFEPTAYLNSQGRTGGGGPGGTGRTNATGNAGSDALRAGCGGGGGAGGPASLTTGGYQNAGGAGGRGADGLVAIYVWR